MKIFEYAMQMELDGEKFYRDIAKQCSDEGTRYIMNMLADDEAKHYKVFETMARGMKADMTDTDIIKTAVNVFTKYQENPADFNSMDQRSLYEEALGLEKQSRDFYMEKVDEVKDNDQKLMLGRIAAEEKRHMRVLENIIELIDHPKQWVEDAEFYRMPDEEF